jgi:RimJ/RimL family protein N-acetyltransferase
MLAGAGLWSLTGLGMWAVAESNNGPAIGHIGFFDFLRGCEPSIEGQAEMGWIFAPAVHGKGYAREACEAILTWFDEKFEGQPVWALISPGNDPSMKLAAKLGFIHETDGIYRDKPQTFWLRST